MASVLHSSVSTTTTATTFLHLAVALWNTATARVICSLGSFRPHGELARDSRGPASCSDSEHLQKMCDLRVLWRRRVLLYCDVLSVCLCPQTPRGESSHIHMERMVWRREWAGFSLEVWWALFNDNQWLKCSNDWERRWLTMIRKVPSAKGGLTHQDEWILIPLPGGRDPRARGRLQPSLWS